MLCSRGRRKYYCIYNTVSGYLKLLRYVGTVFEKGSMETKLGNVGLNNLNFFLIAGLLGALDVSVYTYSSR